LKLQWRSWTLNDPIPIVVPRENVNDESVCLARWLVPDRSHVEVGQPIVEVETSKANMEICAPATGFVRSTCREGDDIEIGRALGYICDEVEADLTGAPGKLVRSPGSRSPQPEIMETKERSTRFSQQALQLIKEWSVDPDAFESMALVRSQDVLKYVREEMARKTESVPARARESDSARTAPVPAAGVTVRTEKLPRKKRLEAKYLWSARQNTLPSAVTVRCSMHGLRSAAERETGIGTDVSAVLIFEVARLLRTYPVFNAYYAAECVHYYDDVNIGFALDAGRGLMVPVIRGADKKSVGEIAEEMRELLIRYLGDDLPVQSVTGGTFTITDLSNDDVYSFHPLINQGQSAILAVCSEFESTDPAGLFNLVLVFDHQLSEGRSAARFLNDLRQHIGGTGSAIEKQGSRTAADRFVLPRTATEEKLAAVWCEVLGLERIGIHDSFLELGGHSLLATQLVFRVQEAFHVELPLRSLFETPTVAGLAATIEQRKRGTSEHVPPAGLVPAPDLRYEPFPLTDVQQAYWIGRGTGVELGNIACHIYAEIDFPDFDRQRCELALERLIKRHDMLRAVVLADGSQKILEETPHYSLEILDLRGQQPESAHSQLEGVRDRMSHQVLDSDRWPLFELRAALLDDQRARLHVSLDLLILDARSIQILAQEFSELYRHPDASLPSLQISFRDYVLAETALQSSDAYRRAQEYWIRRLPSLPPAPELPLARNPNSVARPRFVRRTARLAPEGWNRLKKRAVLAALTPAGVLLAAYAEVLAVYGKSPQFTINVTLFNRLPLHAQVNDVVGDFTSLNMLAVDNSGQDTFEARARRLREQLWTDLDYRYFTGIRVLRELARTHGRPQRTAMPVVFTSFLNLDQSSQDAAQPAPVGRVTYGISQTPQVWLDNLVHEEEGALVSNWDAVEELFPDALLDDMHNSYQLLLNQLASDDASWNRGFAESSRALIPPRQMEVRHEVNNTRAPSTDEVLHTLFLKQVDERPGQAAVCTPVHRLSYAEVYRLACRVEEQLVDRGVGPNQLVAVLMEKGWEQVVAVLGIHLAGGAYLPVDPELPAERQRYLMDQGQVNVVLTQSALQGRLTLPSGLTVVAVDQLEPADAITAGPRRRQKPEDLAYVIYTSGSTGLPKGVMIDHRGAVNTVLDINQRFGVGPGDKVLAVSRLSFDLSVYDIFGLLAAGGTVVIPSAELAHDAAHWAQLMASEKVTIWNTVPALMQLLVEQAGPGEAAQSLRLIMLSGDWIPVNLPGDIRTKWPDAKIVSLGGATEASIWSILYPIENVDSKWTSVPYGRPMLNQSFHVLNQSFAPCPVWVPGQLYIGGIGLAKGYWRDEQKTRASFVTDPATGQMLYRTGDLGRYLPDGNIEFLGREDFQVKVQGHRIELGEIEVRLQEHEGVETCVVVVQADDHSERRLVAYAVPKPGVKLESSELRGYLRAKLPEYMVPSAFLLLERFPLTANGKLDRLALPTPSRIGVVSDAGPTAPRDMLELQLTKLWEKVLGYHPVGLRDNFFDLGGHSLTAVRLFSELRQITGQSLPLSALFQAPTVEQLASLLREKGWSPRWSSLVPIQPGGSRSPFFCVHGGGGNVLVFRGLAYHLGTDYPFYGLQSKGVDDSNDYLTTVDEMAAHYLKEIRELQPAGPYYLGGFCMGGVVAFEMAQRLRQDGQEVRLLAMIDTYNFSGSPLRLSLREQFAVFCQKTEFHWSNIARLDSRERFAYLKTKLKGACARELERVSVKLSSLFATGVYGNRNGNGQAFLEDINDKAYFAYVPSVYDERITVFRPQRNYSFLTKPSMGWSEVVTGGLDVIDLPVEPGGIFIDPYVTTLAEKLRSLIDGPR
jgi:amino acid adenylation domain-containing protein